jgi:hypothetical protein
MPEAAAVHHVIRAMECWLRSSPARPRSLQTCEVWHHLLQLPRHCSFYRRTPRPLYSIPLDHALSLSPPGPEGWQRRRRSVSVFLRVAYSLLAAQQQAPSPWGEQANLALAARET